MKKNSELECFLYYMWNAFNYDKCIQIFGEYLGNHIINKWVGYIEQCGAEGAPALLYANIDDDCRKKLVEAAITYYNK